MTAVAHPGFDDLRLTELSARKGVKWARAVAAQAIPAWVADMDFLLAAEIRDAVTDVVRTGDVGYPNWLQGTPLREEFARRMSLRYGWEPDPESVREHTDLIAALQLILRLATQPGDAVAIQTPNYPPFLATVASMGLRTVPFAYRDTPTGWQLDFAEFERLLRQQRPAVLILVNPHNPTGRVHTRAELERIAELAEEFGTLVISDEIHAELVYAPHQHVPFASLGPATAARTVTLTSASKSFNLAGFRCAVSHFGPQELLARRDSEPPDLYGTVSVPGVVATLAAWRHGDRWQRELLDVLDRNRRRVHDALTTALPTVGHHLPEGTYLSWLDVSATGLEDPVAVVRRDGHVLVDGGEAFGPDSRAFIRVNFATSQAVLDRVLTGVTGALSA